MDQSDQSVYGIEMQDITLETPIDNAVISHINSTLSDWLLNGPHIDTNTYSDQDLSVGISSSSGKFLNWLALLLNSQPALDDNRPCDTYGAARPRQPHNWNENFDWFPWPDKIVRNILLLLLCCLLHFKTCILDILWHLPRTSLSHQQNSIISWAMQIIGVHHVPSEPTMKNVTEALQCTCGIKTFRCQGAFVHIYYTNDLLHIIKQVCLW